MLEHYSQVLSLTNERSFSHAQRHHYYKTIQTVCSADPFAPLLSFFGLWFLWFEWQPMVLGYVLQCSVSLFCFAYCVLF